MEALNIPGLVNGDGASGNSRDSPPSSFVHGCTSAGAGFRQDWEDETRLDPVMPGPPRCDPTQQANRQHPAPSPDEEAHGVIAKSKSMIQDIMSQDKQKSDSAHSWQKRQSAGVFVDAAAMKDQLRLAVGKPQYAVEDFYYEKGWAQLIARHPFFENFTLVIIGVNAIWIAIDTDYNKAVVPSDALPVFQVAEQLFCAYFCFEWLMRFLAFKKKINCCRDAWFLFDSALVILMIMETWVASVLYISMGGGVGNSMGGDASIMKLLRLLRLTRMARMVRLMRILPELMIMIKAMSVAMRTVFFALCLLMGIIYVFAIAFTQLAEGSVVGNMYFRTVPESMNTLLLHGALPDQAEMVNDVGKNQWYLRLLIMVYILAATLLVMNMLVGILCEVVSVVSAVEKEELLISFVQTQLSQILTVNGIDVDGDGRISQRELEALLINTSAARALTEVGVDVVSLVDVMDHIFEGAPTSSGEKSFSFGEFMEAVLQMRGSNTATVKDLVDFRKLMASEIRQIQENISQLTLHLEIS